MGELITFYGATDGTNATGTVSLDSNILYSSVDYIRIPKGVKLKIWGIRAYAVTTTNFNIEFTSDVTVGSPTYETVDSVFVAADDYEAYVNIEKRRPIVIKGATGKEAIRITWSQSAAGNGGIAIDVEFGND